MVQSDVECFPSGYNTEKFFLDIINTTRRRLWGFGVRNTKLFTGYIPRRLAQAMTQTGFQVRVLYQSPFASSAVLNEAALRTSDPVNFHNTLLDRLGQYVWFQRTFPDLQRQVEFRAYKVARTCPFYVVDDKVFIGFSIITTNPMYFGITNTPYVTTSINSALGDRLRHYFEYVWDEENGLSVSIDIKKAIDILSQHEKSRLYALTQLGHRHATSPSEILALLVAHLRPCLRAQPETEKEINDKVEDILRVSGLPYLRETSVVEYSGRRYIPDFTFEEEEFCLEVKLCKSVERLSYIVSEINDDILGYSRKYKEVAILIYSVARISEEAKYLSGFIDKENIYVRIIQH